MADEEHSRPADRLKKRTVKLDLNLIATATIVERALLQAMHDLGVQQNDIIGELNIHGVKIHETNLKVKAAFGRISTVEEDRKLEKAASDGEKKAKKWIPMLIWVVVVAFVGVLVTGFCAFLWKLIELLEHQGPNAVISSQELVNYFLKSVE